MRVWRRVAEERELASELQMAVRQLEHNLAEARIELHEFRQELAMSVCRSDERRGRREARAAAAGAHQLDSLKLDKDFREAN